VDNKQLYNIETDTLITLYPKPMVLEVKQDFIQTYHLDKFNFTVIYLLAVSRPNIVTYQDFFHAFNKIDIDIKSQKPLDLLIIKLKKELKDYSIKDFIIKIKKTGYTISNKWVEPCSMMQSKRNQKFLKIMQRLIPAFGIRVIQCPDKYVLGQEAFINV
jgi:hypothetical protein